MKRFATVLGVALAVFVLQAAMPTFAHPPAGPPSDRMGPPMMGPPMVCSDQQNVYVLVGGKVMQYGASDLKLVKSVDIPLPPPPQDKDKEGTKTEGAQQPPPPPMEGHHGPPPCFGGGPQGPHSPMGGPPRPMLWTGDHALFVMLGPMIYRYSTPDLKLQATLEIPKPECPPAAK